MRRYNSRRNGRPLDSYHSHAFSPSRMIGTSASRPCALLRMRAKKMFGRFGGAHALIREADQIAQVVIAKQIAASRGPAAATSRPDRSASGAGLRAQGSRQNAVVARGPLESAIGRERQRLIGNRAFGRPQSHRLRCQLVLHIRTRTAELLPRVLWISEPSRKRHAGMRHRRDIGIADQRQNRMIERRGRNFDLPASPQIRDTPAARAPAIRAASAPSRPDRRANNRGPCAPAPAIPDRAPAGLHRTRRAGSAPANRASRDRLKGDRLSS